MDQAKLVQATRTVEIWCERHGEDLDRWEFEGGGSVGVYVIREANVDGEHERIKIGYASDVQSRFANHKSSASRALELLLVIPERRTFEAWLHGVLKPARIDKTREWYWEVGPVRRLIEIAYDQGCEVAAPPPTRKTVTAKMRTAGKRALDAYRRDDKERYSAHMAKIAKELLDRTSGDTDAAACELVHLLCDCVNQPT